MENRLEVRGLDFRNLRLGARSWKIEIRAILLTSIFCLLTSQSHAQSINDYLKEAADNNPSLKASYTEFEASMKKVTQVNALPDPKLSLGYFISPIETRVGPQRAKVSLTQMFPWFGTLKVKEEVATLHAESKYHSFLDKKNQLFHQVKQAYYPLHEVHEHIRLQQHNLEILQSYKRLATTSFANGKGTMSNVLRVDIMIDGVATEIQLLEDKLNPLTVSFNRLLTRPDSSVVEIRDPLKMESLPNDYLKDSIMIYNPKIKEMELTIEALKAQEKVAQKNALPQIGIGLDYAFVSERTDVNIPDNGKNAFMPMVTMSIPIFRKKYRSAVEETQLLQTAVEYKIEGMENRLISQYEVAYYEIEKALQLADLYETQLFKTEQVLNLLYTAYGNSGKDFEEVLRMQQQLLKYQMAQATVNIQYYIALAQLEYITAKTN